MFCFGLFGWKDIVQFTGKAFAGKFGQSYSSVLGYFDLWTKHLQVSYRFPQCFVHFGLAQSTIEGLLLDNLLL